MEQNKELQKDLIKKEPKTKPTKWQTSILPNKAEIIKQLENGASERQIYEAFHISKDAWFKTKQSHPEMQEWIDTARSKIVGLLKGALIKKACGFTYDEDITEIKQDLDSQGRPTGKQYVYKRTIHHYSPPDTNAIYGCLKIYDKDNASYDSQAQALEIKRQELELKKQISGVDNESEQDALIEKIKNFKIEIVDASKKDGNIYENKENDTNS